MRLVFLGPPGSGKGTQAELLAKSVGLHHVSTGDMFRQAIHQGSPVGKKVARLVNNGELVPDALVKEVLQAHLATLSANAGFVLDGFPRTVAQAETLEGILARFGWTLDAAVVLRVPEEVIVARLSGRRVCPRCGALYHLDHLPGPEAKCQRCGAPLVTREDDRPQAVRRRLELYWKTARALEDFYAARGLLREVKANGSIEEAQEALLKVLGRGDHDPH